MSVNGVGGGVWLGEGCGYERGVARGGVWLGEGCGYERGVARGGVWL